MFDRPLDEITEEDFQALIDSKIDTQKIERKTVEYKKCLSPGSSSNGTENAVKLFLTAGSEKADMKEASETGIPVINL